MFFSGGVPLFNSNKIQIYPIFIKINELVGCYLTTSKPDVNFFLKYIVKNLVHLFREGIFINRLNRKVYPFVKNFLLDIVARRLFLNHVNFNANNGCTDCFQTGERIAFGKGSIQIYPYEEDKVVKDRTVEAHKQIIEILQRPNAPNSFLGKFDFSKMI